jgi:hypothetical protein
MLTANQCKHFVEAVVNGDDKDSVPAIRNRFARLYRGWFPDDPPDEYCLYVLLNAWRNLPENWWCKDSLEKENPQTFFEWRVAFLRDKLRFVWLADPDTARYQLKMLVADTLNYRPHAGRIEPWRERTLAVCDWLKKWLTARKGSRLLVCQNPECTETKFFVRDTKEPNKKYCSSPCAVRAEVLRRLKQGQHKRDLSPRGLANIRIGQQKRRQRERMDARKSIMPRNK